MSATRTEILIRRLIQQGHAVGRIDGVNRFFRAEPPPRTSGESFAFDNLVDVLQRVSASECGCVLRHSLLSCFFKIKIVVVFCSRLKGTSTQIAWATKWQCSIAVVDAQIAHDLKWTT